MERTLDGCREAREVLLAQADSRDLRKSAHDREREDVVVVHRQRRTIKRALDRLAVDDDDLAAEVVDTPEPEVPDRARFGDAQARLIGAGEQRVDHGELRHGGTGHRRQSHHRWSVPMLGGHERVGTPTQGAPRAPAARPNLRRRAALQGRENPAENRRRRRRARTQQASEAVMAGSPRLGRPGR